MLFGAGFRVEAVFLLRIAIIQSLASHKNSNRSSLSNTAHKLKFSIKYFFRFADLVTSTKEIPDGNSHLLWSAKKGKINDAFQRCFEN